MKTIYKYPLIVDDLQILTLPKGAKVLTVQTQGPMPMLWAMVDPEEVGEEVIIETLGTGQLIKTLPEGTQREYISTYQLSKGALVFHVFKIGPTNG